MSDTDIIKELLKLENEANEVTGVAKRERDALKARIEERRRETEKCAEAETDAAVAKAKAAAEETLKAELRDAKNDLDKRKKVLYDNFNANSEAWTREMFKSVIGEAV